jgi:hypothetical protein
MHSGDTFIDQQLGAYLTGEAAVYTAYLETATGNGFMGVARRKAYWAALTATRLYLIEARVGAFKPLYENKGVRVIERSSIQGVHGSGTSLVIALGRENLQLSTARHADTVSGQALFSAELATRHGGNPVATKIASNARLKAIAGVVAGLAVAGWYGYQYAYGGRAEIGVNCNVVGDEIVCKASHNSGGADAEACWDIRVTCANGQQPLAHACTEVEPGKNAEVTLREQDFTNLADCDQVASSELANLKIDVD